MYPDPSVSNPVGASVAWLQGALLGSIATTAAVIAVAAVGFLMLTGRIDVRRAAQVVFGCFILFGASSIAQGIMVGVHDFGTQQVAAPEAEPVPSTPAVSYPQKPAQPLDPYAGAAVPTQQ